MCIRDSSTFEEQHCVIRFLDLEPLQPLTWIHYFEPESKRQSMEWKHPSSPVKKKFKTQPSAGKVMLTTFWSSQGPIFCDYLQDQRIINSQYYSDMTVNKVKPALKKKCPGWQRKGVILLHDNARPHTAKWTLETIKKVRLGGLIPLIALTLPHLTFSCLAHSWRLCMVSSSTAMKKMCIRDSFSDHQNIISFPLTQ